VPSPAPTDNRPGIVSAYQKYLGRTPGESDIASWIGNNNYEQGISGSPEAAKYRAAQGQPTTRDQWLQQTGASGATTQGEGGAWLGYLNSLTTPQGNVAKQGPVYQSRPGSGFYHLTGGSSVQDIVNQFNQATGGHARFVGGPSGDMVDFGDGRGPVDVLNAQGNLWYDYGQGQAGQPGGGGATAPGMAGGYGTATGSTPADLSGAGTPGSLTGGGGMGPTTGTAAVSGSNTFTDPATAQWETMLRNLVDKLNTAQPTWTPAQMELQQSQIMQPLQQQQDAAKQQMIQQLAARGISQTSGPAIQALADIDRQFQQLRTQQQSALAQQSLSRQDTLFNTNEQRAQQALGTMQQIPQLADQRLAAAQGGITKIDPTQLAALLGQLQNQQYGYGLAGQQYNNQQMQQFWQQLAQIIAGAF
jgi:hypothetical protein